MSRPANPELRDEILKAATKIVEDCGPDCVTMRQVAEEIGYSPTTLYIYFKDKDAILQEVVADGFGDLADFIDQATVGPTPLDKVRQRSRAYIVWGVMHPGLYQLMFESRIEMSFSPEQTERIMRAPSGSIEALVEASTSGQLLRVADPAALGAAAWAAIHGVTSLAISRRLSPDSGSATPARLLEIATGVGDSLVNSVLAPHLA
jgi:AcrR family transcriptional regulator